MIVLRLSYIALVSLTSHLYHISPCRIGISCDFLTIYDDLYKTYLWGICITLNLFVYNYLTIYKLFVFPSKSIENTTLLCLFCKKMYEMHLIMHTIDELSRWVKGHCFIRSYFCSCIRRTYLFVLTHRTHPKYPGS